MQRLLLASLASRRALHTSAAANCVYNTIRSGVYKGTNDRSRPLTYEQAQKPDMIGVRKSWNSINTSNLYREDKFAPKTTVDDLFIRKFIFGTWHGLFVSEVIVKRRHNVIVIAGLIHRNILPRKIYFLKGYTETLLSYLLKQPVKIELQTVEDKRDMYFKWI